MNLLCKFDKFSINFGTDFPERSKTKCIAFLRKKKVITSLRLNNKELPWVRSVKHLGSIITDDTGNRLKKDIVEKRAIYITKNNDLVQEFNFSHFKTKIWANEVYNTSFYGAPLWDMTSREFKMMENTWNVSHRIMLAIPRESHRYFLEPLSGRPHITKSLKKRFLNFISKINMSEKNVLRDMLRNIEYDCRSVTGKNLRNLRLQTNSFDGNIEIMEEPYHNLPTDAKWKIHLVSEILATKAGDIKIDNLSYDNLDTILEDVCCS